MITSLLITIPLSGSSMRKQCACLYPHRQTASSPNSPHLPKGKVVSALLSLEISLNLCLSKTRTVFKAIVKALSLAQDINRCAEPLSSPRGVALGEYVLGTTSASSTLS